MSPPKTSINVRNKDDPGQSKKLGNGEVAKMTAKAAERPPKASEAMEQIVVE